MVGESGTARAERRISPKDFLKLYLGCGAGAIVIWILSFSIESLSGIKWYCLLIGILLVLFAAVYVKLQVLNTHYRVYGDRIEIESGILTKRIENIALFRVRDIGLDQGLLGRLLNFGNITLASTDASSPHFIIKGVDDPRSIYEIVRELVTQSKAETKTMIVEDGSNS